MMPAHRIALFLVLGFLCLGGSCAGGQTVPQPGWIADAADVLTAQQEAELTDLLILFEQRATVQLVGVTVEDLGEQSIEAYTLQLARAWGVGVAGVNNGVMVLLALKQRQVYIDVERGMTWQISEARVAEIVDMMTPFFRDGNYYQGLRTGFEQIIAANEAVAWEVAYFTLDEARREGEQAVGKIAAFEAVITGLEEDVAEIAAPGVEGARLLLTEDIDPLAFSVEDRLMFHARVKEAEPLVLYLLGWEEEEL